MKIIQIAIEKRVVFVQVFIFSTNVYTQVKVKKQL